MNFAESLSRLERKAAASEEPTLSADELVELLTDAAIPDSAGNSPRNVATVASWSGSTNYLAGDVVKVGSPARFYVCALPGISGAVEPTWLNVRRTITDDRATDRTDLRVADGTVIWRDAGSEWSPTYDVAWAAARAWRMKAAKVANQFTFSADGQQFNRDQIMANCLQMATSCEMESKSRGRRQVTTSKIVKD